MKNVGTKILILGIVIAIAVAGILAFYPTIVASPTKVELENLHKTTIENSIALFSESQSTAYNDSVYMAVTDKLKLYKNEEFLSEQEIDYQTKVLVQKYLPVFTSHSYAKFRASEWKESDHKAMLSRIKGLRTLKVDYGEADAVTGSFSSDLTNIESIIAKYNDAKAAAQYSTFYSVTDANKKIDAAEVFRNDQYLKNCKSLMDKLASVKVNIGRSHYNQVVNKVEEMAGYRTIREENFGAYVTAANNMINEYNGNRSKYGSNANTTESIKSKANEYYKNAQAYYESLRKPEISISYHPQWSFMSSPSNDYRGYQSSSNYHKANTNATMSFKIKGYESFTFYIRSNGESDHDYVKVGVNEIPTGSVDAKYSTKGSPSSGTALYYYKTVTIPNLRKSETYTIYVVYCKDRSIDKGDDRGYVLIPYAK